MKIENIFDEADNVRERVKREILGNQELLKLVSINHDNPLSKPNIIGASSLVDKYIYFTPRVYDTTIMGVQNFLLTDIVIASVRNSIKFADIKLIFRIIVHNSLFELEDGKSRANQIASRLMSCFASKTGTWMGKCEFLSGNSIEVPSDYQGLQLVFSMTDFKN